VENAFGQWMMQRYGSLHNLPLWAVCARAERNSIFGGEPTQAASLIGAVAQ
jgi:hypothetical protein